MSVHESKLHEEDRQARREGKADFRPMLLRCCVVHWVSTVLVTFVLIVLQAVPARAQATPSPTPVNPCPTQLTKGQNLKKVPEIASAGGKLRGTLLLSDEQEWMTFKVPADKPPSDQSTSQCVPQYVRTFRELGAVSTMASAPSGPYARGSYALPRPGPTFRARVGDLVQLTFINQINPANFGNSIDRGETGKGGGCDESTAGYPGNPGDKYPDCFHGSSTGNIHFHGTHTTPSSTGDNVFLEVRPSLRVNNKPVVTPQSVEKPFNEFFNKCAMELSSNVLREWPKTWSDLPQAWTAEQQRLLKQYDAQLQRNYGNVAKKLWPVDAKQVQQGAWPQYYIGAFPYCFRLPQYTATTWPPPPADHAAHQGAGTAEQPEGGRSLKMGQAPGTHWYHAHKHGSTAINVANGMTGAFIIEGQYDDDLNAWYGAGWTRTQPVLVINQLGVSPNLLRGGGGPGPGQQDKGPDFSINGQMKPVISMKPGEVQMWRILNTSGRAGVFFTGPPSGFEWKQLAQDGVQFIDANYQSNLSQPFLLAAGNRADLLVKAPATPCTNPQGCIYPVLVQNEVDPTDLLTANKITLLSISISGTPVAPTSNGAKFIPNAPYFPPFLADITDAEIKGTKKLLFASTPPGPGNGHTIDGKKFDGEVGAVVLLNQAEEWKVMNASFGPLISHPFHIHINPFQVTEVFSPNDTLPDPTAAGKTIPKYIFDEKARKSPAQCYLNPLGNPDDWKPCGPAPAQKNLIWWDVFPIPSGIRAKDADGQPIINPATGKQVQVPGYFKLRSRFVDYAGYYVLHCHILAHEDRGMMTVVEVAPARSPYSHH
jgi:FtsP/CotA-like multicopper oxidase with cupredoxin domain